MLHDLIPCVPPSMQQCDQFVVLPVPQQPSHQIATTRHPVQHPRSFVAKPMLFPLLISGVCMAVCVLTSVIPMCAPAFHCHSAPSANPPPQPSVPGTCPSSRRRTRVPARCPASPPSSCSSRFRCTGILCRVFPPLTRCAARWDWNLTYSEFNQAFFALKLSNSQVLTCWLFVLQPLTKSVEKALQMRLDLFMGQPFKDYLLLPCPSCT